MSIILMEILLLNRQDLGEGGSPKPEVWRMAYFIWADKFYLLSRLRNHPLFWHQEEQLSDQVWEQFAHKSEALQMISQKTAKMSLATTGAKTEKAKPPNKRKERQIELNENWNQLWQEDSQACSGKYLTNKANYWEEEAC